MKLVPVVKQTVKKQWLEKPLATQQVLHLYKEILRIGHGWEGLSTESRDTEKEYIKTEARRQNQELQYEDEVAVCIQEAKARIELAEHYKIPYPRPYNTSRLQTGDLLKKGKKDHVGKPAYMPSYYTKE